MTDEQEQGGAVQSIDDVLRRLASIGLGSRMWSDEMISAVWAEARKVITDDRSAIRRADAERIAELEQERDYWIEQEKIRTTARDAFKHVAEDLEQQLLKAEQERDALRDALERIVAAFADGNSWRGGMIAEAALIRAASQRSPGR